MKDRNCYVGLPGHLCRASSICNKDLFAGATGVVVVSVFADLVVVVELPQMPEDDLRSARVVRGRRSS